MGGYATHSWGWPYRPSWTDFACLMVGSCALTIGGISRFISRASTIHRWLAPQGELAAAPPQLARLSPFYSGGYVLTIRAASLLHQAGFTGTPVSGRLYMPPTRRGAATPPKLGRIRPYYSGIGVATPVYRAGLVHQGMNRRLCRPQEVQAAAPPELNGFLR